MALADCVRQLGPEHRFTALVPDLSDGADPDDAFSRVPYEKGFALLTCLEDAAGGPAAFEPFLRGYLATFRRGTVTTADFQAAYAAAFGSLPAAAAVDWDVWLHGLGMPPVDLSLRFDLSQRAAADALAKRWHFCDVLGVGAPCQPDSAAAADVEGWPSEQLVAFLDRLCELRSMTPLSAAACIAMDGLYGLSKWKNSEAQHPRSTRPAQPQRRLSGDVTPTLSGALLLAAAAHRSQRRERSAQRCCIPSGAGPDEVPAPSLSRSAPQPQPGDARLRAGHLRAGARILPSHRCQDGCAGPWPLRTAKGGNIRPAPTTSRRDCNEPAHHAIVVR